MQRRLRTRIDGHLLAAIAIALIAALPLLTRPGLPRHTDLELHVFRAAEYRLLVERHPFEYPRWAPDFYYGYGYPIFDYYAPLTYFAASLFAAIPGLSVAGAMKIVLVLTFGLASLGAFFFARRHFGSPAGVVAAGAYVLSPYLLFIDPYRRGDAAEFLALGLLPWLFLAFDRPLRSARQVGLAALTLAAFVFSHNLMALIGAGMLLGWLIWRGLLIDGAGRWPRDLAAILLAAGVTAIFWLPFMAERGAIRLEVAGPGHFDFRNHFVGLTRLMRPSPILDMGATTPHFIYNLGLVQWLLALPALLALRRASGRAAPTTVFFLLLSMALIFMITPFSQSVWESVPLAAYVQFPWRLLGPAAFALAMCAASGVAHLRNRFFAPAGLALLLVFALPTMYPPLWEAEFGDTSARGHLEFELSGVALGTTSTGDFLPRAVSRLPAPAPSLMAAYAADQSIDRFDYAGASGARLAATRIDDLAAEYAVESSAGFTARFFVFAFPGWQAYVDGQPVASRATSGDGFLAFDVPVSARNFGIRFESTLPRTFGAILSLTSIAAAVALIGWPRLRRAVVTTEPTEHPSSPSAIYLLLTLVAFLALRLLVLDRCDTCFRYTSPPGQALAASNRQRANFGNHIELLGYDLPRLEVASGQALPLTLYWRATAPVAINYQVFAHLTRPATILWGQSDKLNPGDFPSTRWPLDKYVWDDHVIRVLPGTPPGDYVISVGLYTLADGRRAPVIDSAGGIVGDSAPLSLPVRVTRPSTPPAIESLGIQTPLDMDAGGLTLVGALIEQATLARPNFARLTLFWRAKTDAPGSITVRARMIDGEGRMGNEIVTSPVDGAYPTSEWRAGEIVRDVYAFWLPPDFPAGRYTLTVALDADGGPFEVGSIEVRGP